MTEKESIFNIPSEILENFMDGVVVTDLKLKILYANNAVLEKLGYTREDGLGKPLYDYMEKTQIPQALVAVKEGLTKGFVKGLKFTAITKEGNKFPVRINGSIIKDEKGIPQKLFIVLRDMALYEQTEELKSSEERLKIIFENAPDAYYLSDVKGNIIEVNKASEKIIGHKKEELIGGNFLNLNLLPKDQIPRAAAALAKNVLGLPIGPEEYIVNRKDGGKILVEVRTYPVKIKGQNLILAIIRDITESKKAEEIIKKSEERYRMIFNSTSNILAQIDKAGTIVDVNEQIKNIGGYEPKDFIGKKINALAGILTPKSVAIMAANFAKRMLGFKIDPYEVEGRSKDGRPLFFEISAAPLKNTAGENVGELAILYDITERKRAEEKYRYLFEKSINILLTLDPSGNIIDASESAEKALGYKKEEVMGTSFRKFVPVKYVPVILKNIALEIAGRPTPFMEIEIKAKDGRLIPVEFTPGAVRLYENNKLTGITVSARDMTEKKKAEAEIKKTQEMLIQSEKLAAIGELASGVAHEIKNPLGIVVQGADYLEQNISKDNKDQLEALGMIREAVQRANNIIRGLLNFSRPSPLKIEPVKIEELINYALSLIKADLNLKQVEVIQEIKMPLPLIKLDKNQITQVFINLFLNSLQAMSEGGKLIIRAYLRKESLVCEVEDTGKGVRKENLRRIFDPFFTTKPPGQGVGLGLSVTHTIIENHGGQISVESEEGKGTKVIIILPVSRREE